MRIALVLFLALTSTSCTFVRSGDGIAGNRGFGGPTLTIEQIDDWLEKIDDLEENGVDIHEWTRENRPFKHVPNWWQASEEYFEYPPDTEAVLGSITWNGVRGNLYALRSSAQVIHNPVKSLFWSTFQAGNEIFPRGCFSLHLLSLIVAPLDVVILPIQLAVMGVQDANVSDEEIRAALDDLGKARRAGFAGKTSEWRFPLPPSLHLDVVGFELPKIDKRPDSSPTLQ